MQGFLSKIIPHALEIVLLAAFALIAFGVSLVYLPAAFIVGGLLLVAIVIDSRL